MEFVNKLMRAIAHVAERMRAVGGPSRYRPEKHYMRGGGPKNRGRLDPPGGQKPNGA